MARTAEVSMTKEELLGLPVAVDIVTAGRAFGIGRTKSHELAKAGEFPCRVLRLGIAYRVPRSDLLRVLGIEEEPQSIEEAQSA